MTELPTMDPRRGAQPSSQLPVLDTARRAYGMLWARRDDVLRLAVVPVILLLGFNVLLTWALDIPMAAMSGEPPKINLWALLAMLLAWIPVSLFVANWLRVLLLGGDAVASLGLRWGLRETKFLLRIFLVLLIAMLGAAAVALPVGIVIVLAATAAGMIGVAPAGPGNQVPDFFALIPLLIAVLVVAAEVYVGLRLSLAFPATAVDRSRVIRLSWTMTRGTGLRLHAAVLLVAVPFYAAIYAAQILLGLAGVHLLAPFSLTMVAVAMNLVAMAGAACVLAIVYRRLDGAVERKLAS